MGARRNQVQYVRSPEPKKQHARSGALVFVICRSRRHLLKNYSILPKNYSILLKNYSGTCAYGRPCYHYTSSNTYKEVVEPLHEAINSILTNSSLKQPILDLPQCQRSTGSTLQFSACWPTTRAALSPLGEQWSWWLLHPRSTTCWHSPTRTR